MNVRLARSRDVGIVIRTKPRSRAARISVATVKGVRREERGETADKLT
jgi:hypothetical protein